MNPAKRQAVILGMILAAALIGAATSATLTAAHAGSWELESAGSSFFLRLCRLGSIDSASCADVIDSRWGSFDTYLGSTRIVVPTSLIGFVYFSAVFIWFAMLGSPRYWPDNIRRIALAMLSLSMLVSIGLVAIMAVDLEAWCTLCLIAHACNAVIVLFGWLYCYASNDRQADVNPIKSSIELLASLRRKVALASVIATIGLACGAWLLFDVRVDGRRQWRKLAQLRQAVRTLQRDGDFVMREFHAQSIQSIPRQTSTTSHASTTFVSSTLATHAPHVVVFTDYDCNGCACFDEHCEGLVLDTLGPSAQIEIRHFPRALAKLWSNSSNLANGVDIDVNQLSEIPPSFAAEAARMQGGSTAFSQMHRLLFDHEEARHTNDYVALAEQIGLDTKRFLTDLHSDDVREHVQYDIALAQELGVQDVPAVFLNGQRVPDLIAETPTFWHSVAAELATQGPIVASKESNHEPNLFNQP